MRSPLYKSQRAAAARGAPPDVRVKSMLQALAARGGKLTREALAARLALPAIRLEPLIAAAGRLLNVDGYAVLAIDNNADSVELNIALLKKQFALAEP